MTNEIFEQLKGMDATEIIEQLKGNIDMLLMFKMSMGEEAPSIDEIEIPNINKNEKIEEVFAKLDELINLDNEESNEYKELRVKVQQLLA